jgi:hypothetical protein
MRERERFLQELERRLPFALGARRRVLAEVREHLRDGGEESLRRFGSVDQLATELNRELRMRAAARASWLAPLLVVAFLVPFYVVPENTLPAAPWSVKPHYLAWKQHVVIAAVLIAAALAITGFAVGRLRPRLAFVPLVGSALSLAVAVTFGAIVAVQWLDAVPGTSAAITYASIVASFALLAGLVCLALEALPHRGRDFAAD